MNVQLECLSIDILEEVKFNFGLVTVDGAAVVFEVVPRSLWFFLLFPFVFILFFLSFDVLVCFDTRLRGVRQSVYAPRNTPERSLFKQRFSNVVRYANKFSPSCLALGRGFLSK